MRRCCLANALQVMSACSLVVRTCSLQDRAEAVKPARQQWNGIMQVKRPDSTTLASCRPPRPVRLPVYVAQQAELNALLPMYRGLAAAYPTSEDKVACSYLRVLAARMHDKGVMASAQQGALLKLNLTPVQWDLVSAVLYLALYLACSWRLLSLHPSTALPSGRHPAAASVQVISHLGLPPALVADIDSASCSQGAVGHKHSRDAAEDTGAAGNSCQVCVPGLCDT